MNSGLQGLSDSEDGSDLCAIYISTCAMRDAIW